MRFTAFIYFVFLLAFLPSPSPHAAEIDLTRQHGVDLVKGAWRYSDVQLVPTRYRGADTWDYAPHAGLRDFDDSEWSMIDPATLSQRRGHGRISFNWYRIAITVPQSVDGVDVSGSNVELETSLDDYAEVWVDGELSRLAGQSGGSVVAGWNATNRLLIGRNVKPGQKIQLAIFGINGPISDPPTNFIWLRLARLSFQPGSSGPVAVSPQEVNVRVVRNDLYGDRKSVV